MNIHRIYTEWRVIKSTRLSPTRSRGFDRFPQYRTQWIAFYIFIHVCEYLCCCTCIFLHVSVRICMHIDFALFLSFSLSLFLSLSLSLSHSFPIQILAMNEPQTLRSRYIVDAFSHTSTPQWSSFEDRDCHANLSYTGIIAKSLVNLELLRNIGVKRYL